MTDRCWLYCETKGTPKNHYGFYIRDKEKGKRICEGFRSDEPHSREKRKSQGLLIAAAPDLLEALKNLLAEGMTQTTVEQAVRAINKATGNK